METMLFSCRLAIGLSQSGGRAKSSSSDSHRLRVCLRRPSCGASNAAIKTSTSLPPTSPSFKALFALLSNLFANSAATGAFQTRECYFDHRENVAQLHKFALQSALGLVL